MNPHSEPHEPGIDDTHPHGARPTRAPRNDPDPHTVGTGHGPTATDGDPAPPPPARPSPPAPSTPHDQPPTPYDPPSPALSCSAHPPPAEAGSPTDAADPTAPAAGPPAEPQVTLRGPAELADALPYLLGFYPDDSIVMVAVHGERARFGGRLRLGIPTDPSHWPDVGDQLADCLISGARKRADRLVGVLVFLCREPAPGQSGQDVKERLRPLAQRLRTACGALDVPVLEALCLSNGRYWSYCCPDYRCCPADGTPLFLPGTSVMAAAAAYAGMQVRGSLKEMEARLAPRTGRRGADQEKALDEAAAELLPRMLRPDGATAVQRATLERTAAMIHRFRQDTPSGSNRARDACDDALITDTEAATLILGLQDRTTRDRAAEWMDGPDAAAALRLWRALARRCTGGYGEHAAAPLTLAGWVCWSTADGPAARVALSRALTADPDCLFAQLLHRAINEGLDPEPLRRCLRRQREEANEPDEPDEIEATDETEETEATEAIEEARTAETAADGTAAPPAGRRQPAQRPTPPRPGDSARTRGPRGGTGPGSRTTGASGDRRTGRDGDRSRR
ncbi:DUF4192 domain-containing protein [Streptomyces yunnanensis]|uniref:DUF4192 domain-containing protein n=1 Tax=Streptomyces yunnanensis TaxID=156453 RepID=A0ABY8A8D1_9ACTN|nr:DUF4192 domain-containing protein [Streptomyces yunnanensis]WEB39986.1 DUF4192 domain-containing protein [Streptomyces yunnanensis]